MAGIHNLVQEIAFRYKEWPKFNITNAGMTLKIKSKSPNLIKYSPSKQCFHTSMVKRPTGSEDNVWEWLDCTLFIGW